jgi:hypothetical protein
MFKNSFREIFQRACQQCIEKSILKLFIWKKNYETLLKKVPKYFMNEISILWEINIDWDNYIDS